jgi:hypothetical protein
MPAKGERSRSEEAGAGSQSLVAGYGRLLPSSTTICCHRLHFGSDLPGEPPSVEEFLEPIAPILNLTGGECPGV